MNFSSSDETGRSSDSSNEVVMSASWSDGSIGDNETPWSSELGWKFTNQIDTIG